MKTEGPSDELHEVEEELIMKKSGDDNSVNADIHVEEGNNSSSSSNSKSQSNTSIEVFTQALTLTFLAEWGDRSQIATIALAASKNIVGVILGGLLGHAFCTGVAVIGGRLLAAKISEKAVATIGGILFLVFAFHSFITGSDI
jgi:putative Ca2+/H+ antiporter (TMEM165/GDT1 family)